MEIGNDAVGDDVERVLLIMMLLQLELDHRRRAVDMADVVEQIAAETIEKDVIDEIQLAHVDG